MNKNDKSLCKAMIRQANYAIEQYDKHNCSCYPERLLVWRGIEAVLDYMPDMTTHRKHNMREYIERITSRIWNI